jgi:hypothetical protein
MTRARDIANLDGLLTTTGDTYYASAAATPARLGIGSTDQVLTVSGGLPTWATPVSGGMTLISTTTLTGASVTLSSIPQTYNNLFLVIRNFKPATDGSIMRMRFNGDATANRHTNQAYYSVFYYEAQFTFTATSSQLSAANDNTVSSSLITVEIPDYTNTATWKMAETTALTTDNANTAAWQFVKGAPMYNQTTAISSLEFFASSGNLTSGTILLYGVK